MWKRGGSNPTFLWAPCAASERGGYDVSIQRVERLGHGIGCQPPKAVARPFDGSPFRRRDGRSMCARPTNGWASHGRRPMRGWRGAPVATRRAPGAAGTGAARPSLSHGNTQSEGRTTPRRDDRGGGHDLLPFRAPWRLHQARTPSSSFMVTRVSLVAASAAAPGSAMTPRNAYSSPRTVQ